MKKKLLTNELVGKNSGNTFINHLGILPNPDKVLSRYGKNFDTYRELKNDPHVWSCIQSRKSGVLAMNWEITGEHQDDRLRFILDYFADFDVQQLLRDILEAPMFGYQPLELIWENVGKYFLISEISPTPQEAFFYDNDRKFKLFSADRTTGIDIPEMKILNPRFEANWLNPYGTSLLSKCFWPVTFKNSSQRFWVNFMEKYGMPITIGTFNRGATQEEITKLADALATMVEDTVIVTPSDINIELKEAHRTPTVELYKEMLKYCNTEISKALLSQTLTTELDMGSYAAAQTHLTIRKEVILGDISLVEQTMNRLISYLVKANFSDSKSFPKFRITIKE
jgi:phage gp29-like protein